MDIRKKKIIKSSSEESVVSLVKKAREAYDSGKPDRSTRYIAMAFELMKKNRIKVPKELKNSFCRKCHLIWVPGTTVTAYFDTKNECLRLKCRCGFTKRV